MKTATVMYDNWGSYAEWYRDDDDNSGYGDNPRTARWYGSRDECKRLAARSAPPAGTPWVATTGWEPEMSPGSAAWCESCGDNF
jgi:hypothetical protein